MYRLHRLLLCCLLPVLAGGCSGPRHCPDTTRGSSHSDRPFITVAPYATDAVTALLLHFDGAADDVSSLRRPVTATNTAWTDDAVIGRALLCDGAQQLTTTALTNLAAGFTAEAWVYMERPDAGGDMLLAAQAGAFEAGISANSSIAGRPFIRVRTDAGVFTCRAETFLPYGYWLHIAFIYDPAAKESDAQLNIMVQGQSVRFPRGSSKRDALRGRLLQDADALRLAENFCGRIDELRVSTRARSANEIVAPWLSGRVGDYVPFVPDIVTPPPRDQTVPWLTAVQAVPTFHSIGLYARYASTARTNDICRVRWRPAGASDWRSGADLVADRQNNEFRGSLLLLAPDTAYDIELEPGAADAAPARRPQTVRLTARTWPEDVPIAEERTLPVGVSQGPLVINAQGRPDGWIRYRPPVGAESVITASLDVAAAVRIENSAYVIFENAVVQGGGTSAIQISDAHHVRVRRCEFAEWGPVSRQGSHGRPVDEAGVVINNVPAVNLMRLCRQVVVEDCFIHNPNASGGSWRYGHPVGPQGFLLGLDGSHNNVIRNNEIIAGENCWWNDAIEGRGNPFVHGGPYRDTDIYGNFIAFANDNAVELDGGQMNVRFWDNRMEAIYRSISFSPNRMGPSYAFLNLEANQGAEYFLAGTAFKAGAAQPDPGMSFIFHNTIVGRGGPKLLNQDYDDAQRGIRAVVRNNLAFRTGWYRAADVPPSIAYGPDAPVFVAPDYGDYRLAAHSPGAGAALPAPWLAGDNASAAWDMGAFIAGTNAAGTIPKRTSGLAVLPQQLNISHIEGRPPDQPASLELMVPPDIGAHWRARPTETWLHCVPDSGTAGAMPQAVRVEIDHTALTKPGLRRAAIVFRTDTGLNRTVICLVRTQARTPARLVFDAASGTYSAAMAPVSDADAHGKTTLRVKAATFQQPVVALTLPVNVPAAGRYFVWMRYRQPPANPSPNIFNVTINDNSRVDIDVVGRDGDWLWAMLAHTIHSKHDAAAADGTRAFDPRAFSLAAGVNKLTFAPRIPGVELDCVVLTHHPLLEKSL